MENEITPPERPPNKKWLILMGLVILFSGATGIYLYKNRTVSVSKIETPTKVIAIENNMKATITTFGEVSKPMAIKKDRNGNILVCDFGGDNVKIFNPELKLVKQLGDGKSSEPGKFYMPHSIDFDSEGNVYITEFGNKRIQKFSSKWEFISVIPMERTLAGPATAYFDQNYDLYISDYGSNSLVKTTKDGKFLGWIGAKVDGTLTDGWEMTGEAAKSTRPGGFDRVHSVESTKDGVMYVVDTWNHRIERFSKDGKFLGWIGAKVDGTLTDGWEMTGEAKSSNLPGGFAAPIALEFVNEDEIMVLEYENHRIQRFSKEGKFLGWFGAIEGGGITEEWKMDGLPRMGSELGAFKSPYDFHIDGNTIYIADTSNGRIQIVTFK